MYGVMGQLIWRSRFSILAGLGMLVALPVYLFFISAGTWTHWPQTGRYYDDLAVAFRAGRLDLNIQPPAELLALSDPYDPSRKSAPGVGDFVNSHWDLSLYNGKFYAYWGPAPALFLVLIKFISKAHIPDGYLAFGFICGLMVVTLLLVMRMRQRFGKESPAFLTGVCVLVAALAVPMPWMLNRARVYEAAISAGQFFLVGGLFFAYLAVEREKTSKIGLLLAAVCWSFAIGSRLTTILAVVALAGTTFLFALVESSPKTRVQDSASYAAALGIPLAAGLAALGWYSWARFGSVLETGLRYQLTDTNMRLFYSQTFSARYIAPNALLYLLNPFALQSRFPFLVPAVMHLPAALHIGQLRIYHVQNSVGLLVAMPFALFAVLPLVKEGSRVGRVLRGKEPLLQGGEAGMLSWLTWSLAGAIIVSLGMLLAFFYVAVRYLVEFMPSLILLSTLGVWQGYRHVEQSKGARRLYILLVIALAIVTIVVSILLAFAEDGGTLVRFNPQLMRQLIHFFPK